MHAHLATLLDNFRRYDRDIAVVRYEGNRRRVTTYGELAHLAGRFAALLEQRGIRSGDRVLLWGDNSAEWIAAFFGCVMRGVLAVPLDAAGSADFAHRIAADVHPRLAIGSMLLLDHLDGSFPRLAFEELHTQLPGEQAAPLAGLGPDTPLQILFTSGTTGDPKGIVITHGNVLASIGPVEAASQPYLRYERLIHPLRILHTLPLSHVFGQTMGLWVPQIYRAEVHLETRLAAPRLIETIHRERISVAAAVPRVLALLKAELELEFPWLAARIAAGRKLEAWQRWWVFRKIHLRFGLKFWSFVSGGGALPRPLEQFWNALGIVLVQGYGMTETTALITLNHPFHVARGTIGKPLAGREVKLGPDGEVLVRGPMISGATWSGGQMRARESEWLATGDIAVREPSGDLKFVGRKSEVIVTAAGLNIHPEDLEAVLENQPGIAACAVVPLETPAGPEPCAVLATRGDGAHIAAAVEHANARLADFQHIRRWVLYPEPDLPRTSTGKVKRKEVAAWLNRMQRAGADGASTGAFDAQSDWLLALIAQISGETPPGIGDELRLEEDLHLDSLARVQLAAAIEQRLGVVSGSGLLEEARTLGDLRKRIAGQAAGPESAGPPVAPDTAEPEASEAATPARSAFAGSRPQAVAEEESTTAQRQPVARAQALAAPRSHLAYPTWPWWRLMQGLRAALLELIARPLTRLLAAPRVQPPRLPAPSQPILIVANHVTAYDLPLILSALPAPLRRRLATAMSGEMLDDFRHARHPRPPRPPRSEDPAGRKPFFLWGPPAYWLVTALFNVFPLPRLRDFQASFDHAGRALDHGYNVLVFPEGMRTAGLMTHFRPGIGILVKQCHTAVLPIGIRGLGELRASRRWFRSGKLEIHIGEPIQFSPRSTEAEITQRLRDEVARLAGE
jgi:long-chain acyl-CoA synthetase